MTAVTLLTYVTMFVPQSIARPSLRASRWAIDFPTCPDPADRQASLRPRPGNPRRRTCMLLCEGSYFVVGGAGFIGSHFTDAFLASPLTRRVTLFDNFSSGRDWHFEQHRNDPRLTVIRADASDVNSLTATMEGHDWVIHLASNPDIALAAENPEIDFYRGTMLTNNVVEAMRRAKVKHLFYAS